MITYTVHRTESGRDTGRWSYVLHDDGVPFISGGNFATQAEAEQAAERECARQNGG